MCLISAKDILQPVWVVGCRGMLGRQLLETLAAAAVNACGSDRECDFTELANVTDFIARHRPQCIINAAAYTAVDAAEDHAATAWHVNVRGAANLAKGSAQMGAHLIHLSTDYVFDGTASSPYPETVPPAPLGVYGHSKAAAERLVTRLAPSATIVRTAWLYGRYGHNFVHTMLRLMNERPTLKVVADQYGSPTSVTSLCAVLSQLATGRPETAGIFHVTDAGVTTWFDFAQAIATVGKACGLVTENCQLVPCTTAEYPTKAQRPAYAVLEKNKIQKLLGRPLPPWREALVAYLQTLAKANNDIGVVTKESIC